MKCACQDVLVVCLLGYELNIKQAHISATPNMLYLCGLLKNGIVLTMEYSSSTCILSPLNISLHDMLC